MAGTWGHQLQRSTQWFVVCVSVSVCRCPCARDCVCPCARDCVSVSLESVSVCGCQSIRLRPLGLRVLLLDLWVVPAMLPPSIMLSVPLGLPSFLVGMAFVPPELIS